MIRKIATFKTTSHSKLVMVFFVLLMLVAPAISAPIDFPAYVIPGSNWYVGTSAPTSSIGSSGDFYLQNSTGMIYQKIIGTWTAQGILTGPAGTAINESYAYLPGRADGQTLYGSNVANGDLVLSGTSSSTKTTSYVILQPDGGNVGINTQSPTSALEVVGGLVSNSSSRKRIEINATYGGSRNIITDSVSGDSGILYYRLGGSVVGYSNSVFAYSSYDNKPNKFGSSGINYGQIVFKTPANRIEFSNAGNASPIYFAAQTDFANNVRFSYLGAGTLTTDAGGNITAVSDEKLKTNIRRIPASGNTNIDKIKALSPTCYHFSPSSGLDTQNEYCGFLAGEVKKVIPEAVKTKQDIKIVKKYFGKSENKTEDEYETVEIPTGTTTDSLDDRAIIITLVNAVKEQQAEIEQLQAKVARLEGKKVDKTV